MSTEPKSRRCRWGIHDWSIYTEPIHVRHCYRCEKRDPEEPTVFEILWGYEQFRTHLTTPATSATDTTGAGA